MAERPASDPAARLTALAQDFRARLPERLAAIDEAWVRVAADRETAETGRELLRLVHNLSGSGATFGIGELSVAARDLERRLQAALNAPAAASAGAWTEAEAALGLLRAVIRRIAATSGA